MRIFNVQRSTIPNRDSREWTIWPPSHPKMPIPLQREAFIILKSFNIKFNIAAVFIFPWTQTFKRVSPFAGFAPVNQTPNITELFRDFSRPAYLYRRFDELIVIGYFPFGRLSEFRLTGARAPNGWTLFIYYTEMLRPKGLPFWAPGMGKGYFCQTGGMWKGYLFRERYVKGSRFSKFSIWKGHDFTIFSMWKLGSRFPQI